MSLNQSFTLNNSNDYSNSIDFQINENFSQSDYKGSSNKPCGDFLIDGHTYKLSTRDLDRIIDTMQSARDVIYKKFKLGLMIS